MTRLNLLALLTLIGLNGACSAIVNPDTTPFEGDGGTTERADAAPERFCSVDSDCMPGEECRAWGFPVHVSSCKPIDLPMGDAGPMPEGDAGLPQNDGGGTVVEPDAGTPPVGSCWSDRRVSVGWRLLRLTGASCVSAGTPEALVTNLHAGCEIEVGVTWITPPTGQRVSGMCERVDAGSCEAELLYPTVLAGEAMFVRAPAYDDQLVMTYGDCTATWLANHPTEGAPF